MLVLTNFPCVPLHVVFLKILICCYPDLLESILVFPVSIKYHQKDSFCSSVPAPLFSFCSHVPNEFNAMFPCSLNLTGEASVYEGTAREKARRRARASVKSVSGAPIEEQSVSWKIAAPQFSGAPNKKKNRKKV